MDKKEIRKSLKEKRKNISKEKKIILDKAISARIIDSDYFKNAQQILVFSSTDDEFDTKLIIESCRNENKKVFYPLCTDSNGNMKFFQVNSFKDLALGMYGIYEPKPYCIEYKPQENDVIIVPCLSVDKNGYRIGYGKGYYDRFLKDFNGVSICPCYEELVANTLPTDKYDIKVKIIMTQNSTKEVIL